MKWKKEEIEILRNSYLSKKHIGEIAKELNKSIRAVHHKAARMGLSRNPIKIKNDYNRKIADKKYYENNKKEIYTKKIEKIREFKKLLVNILGKKCNNCGYNKCLAAIEFHHKDSNKENSIARLLKDYSKQKALKEAHKCILLCANCHREVHHKGA